MRALLSVVPGGLECLVLDEVDLPPAFHRATFHVASHACAVNCPDVLLISDRYQRRSAAAFAPGIDIAGVVEDRRVPMCVPWRVGDRVMNCVVRKYLPSPAQQHRTPRHTTADSLQEHQVAGLNAAVTHSRVKSQRY